MIAGLMACGAAIVYPLIAIAIGIWAGLRTQHREWLRYFFIAWLGASFLVGATTFGLTVLDWKIADDKVRHRIADGRIISETTSGARTNYEVEYTHPVHGWKARTQIERQHYSMPFVPTVRWGVIFGFALATFASFSRSVVYALRSRRQRKAKRDAASAPDASIPT